MTFNNKKDFLKVNLNFYIFLLASYKFQDIHFINY